MLYNPDFNCTEFGTIKNVAGSNNFVLSVKTWIERTSAIGIRSKAARLVSETWIVENQLPHTYWCHKAKPYSDGSHTDTSIIYANEADVLNVAMFGMTAKQWREANPELKGNIRDYATINELICLSNMENLNAVFIEQNMTQRERLVKLNQIAIHQMSILGNGNNRNRKLLK